MTRIGLLSDTHSFLDAAILKHFEDCNEIWHAGDFGNLELLDEVAGFKAFRGVYGNIDGQEIRIRLPKDAIFYLEGYKIWMTHIGGYPNHYSPDVKKEIQIVSPDIFICGHSHILKIIKDPRYKFLVINPGAAGKYGFHKIRTIVKFDLDNKKILNMKVIELGTRV